MLVVTQWVPTEEKAWRQKRDQILEMTEGHRERISIRARQQ